jgi:PKD repeat protein
MRLKTSKMNKSFLTFAATVGLTSLAFGQNVSTYAGKQYLGSGDYNATSNNNLLDELYSYPLGIAVDNNNRMWVTDQHNIMILDGSLSRIRGGFLGDPNAPGAIGTDNGTATVSRFNTPQGVEVNKNTNDVYIVDTDNALIRKGTQFVNVSNGTVFSTVAGNYSFTGDHVDGLTSAAYFSSPTDIAINSAGEMYICDFGNEVIRKISGGKVTTIAGKPKTSGDATGVGSNARFYAPTGICLENDNSMLIADRNNKKIKRLNLSTNDVTDVITTGLNFPTDVVAVNGRIFVADQYCIKVYDGSTLKVYAGQEMESGYVDGAAKDAKFGLINLFTYRKADSAFYICDQVNNIIRRLTLQDPPSVTFVANKTSVNVNQTVALTSSCTRTTSYTWSITPASYTLISGSKLTDKDLFVSFNSTGSYTVTLVGANSSDKTTVTKLNYINVSNTSNLKPVCDFTADVLTPNNVQTVRLFDLSDNTPTSWQWTIAPTTFAFQNSTTAASKNIDVKFSAFGMYSVTLKVTNTTGTDQKTKTNYITVAANSNKALNKTFITLFPNPATDKITVRGVESLSEVVAMSASGAMTKLFVDGSDVDVSNLSDGVYFITLTDVTGGVYQTKLIVNH